MFIFTLNNNAVCFLGLATLSIRCAQVKYTDVALGIVIVVKIYVLQIYLLFIRRLIFCDQCLYLWYLLAFNSISY